MPRVVHFEIHADDPERAAAFYSSVFGWEIMKWDGPFDYWLVRTGPREEMGIDGGILRRQGSGPCVASSMSTGTSLPCSIMHSIKPSMASLAISRASSTL